jgi:hypothetical protein
MPVPLLRAACLQVIKEARSKLAAQYGPKAVAFEFAQVRCSAGSQALQLNV